MALLHLSHQSRKKTLSLCSHLFLSQNRNSLFPVKHLASPSARSDKIKTQLSFEAWLPPSGTPYWLHNPPFKVWGMLEAQRYQPSNHRQKCWVWWRFRTCTSLAKCSNGVRVPPCWKVLTKIEVCLFSPEICKSRMFVEVSDLLLNLQPPNLSEQLSRPAAQSPISSGSAITLILLLCSISENKTRIIVFLTCPPGAGIIFRAQLWWWKLWKKINSSVCPVLNEGSGSSSWPEEPSALNTLNTGKRNLAEPVKTRTLQVRYHTLAPPRSCVSAFFWLCTNQRWRCLFQWCRTFGSVRLILRSEDRLEASPDPKFQIHAGCWLADTFGSFYAANPDKLIVLKPFTSSYCLNFFKLLTCTWP